MKKTVLVLLLSVLLLVGGCSGAAAPNKIVGKWTQRTGGDPIEFFANGTFTDTTDSTSPTGSYRLEGDTLTLVVSGKTFTGQVTWLTDDNFEAPMSESGGGSSGTLELTRQK